MFKTKFFATLLIVLAVLFVQVGGVLAAPAAQDTTPITGTVTGITTETVDGVTTVLVTVENEMGTQTYRLSVADADALDLVAVDGTTVTINDAQIQQPITLDPALVIADEEVDEEPFNPVAGMLATFFGVTNAEINAMHEDGFGFGVIAQALWISTDADGNTDADLATDILVAKQSKDFETFFTDHPELLEAFGGDVPSNWGQFKKALKENKENLGQIMSGHASNGDDATTTQNGNGNGNGNGRNNNNGNHGGGNNGNGKGNNP